MSSQRPPITDRNFDAVLGKETFRFIQSHSTRYKFDKGAGKVMTIVRVGREQDGGESAKNI